MSMVVLTASQYAGTESTKQGRVNKRTLLATM